MKLICDVCKKPIHKNQEGYVHLPTANLTRHEDAVKQWEARKDAKREKALAEADTRELTGKAREAYGNLGASSFFGDELEYYPRPARWEINHAACDSGSSSVYWFDVTDWNDFVRPFTA